MKYFFKFRPIKFFFYKNWYGFRNPTFYEEYKWIFDFGAITVGEIK